MAFDLVHAVAAHVDSVINGPNGDYPSLVEALSGVDAAQAVWKPAPQSNSIWQIVDHMRASNLWLIEVIETGKAESPIWKEPEGGEAAWQDLLGQQRQSHEQLLEVLRSLPADQLLNTPDSSPPRKSDLEYLLSATAHAAFHVGQIDYLKGLLASVTRSE